jgi:hypothetical protein
VPNKNFDASVIRYGVGTATDFPGGVIVRWSATYQPASGTWSTSTPVPQSLSSVPGESCWTGGMPTTYATAGCEHFGISTTGVNPTSITYRWLVRDPANPGTLIGNSTYVNIPAPVWTVVPPANPALPPVVVAEVQAPPAPPALYGEAQWVKVYKTEQQAKVDLKRWISWARRSRLDPFKRLATTLKQHFDSVIRGMLDNRSNAFVEAMNGVLQQAKRAARGFRTATSFIAIAYLRLGKLTHLPASPFVRATARAAT